MRFHEDAADATLDQLLFDELQRLVGPAEEPAGGKDQEDVERLLLDRLPQGGKARPPVLPPRATAMSKLHVHVG